MQLFKELFWKERHLGAYLDYFKRDKKKFTSSRYLLAGFLFLLYAISVLIVKEYWGFLGLPVVFWMGYKLPYLQLLMQKKEKDLLVSFLFPPFLQSFIALLPSSGNVYQTLKVTVEYTGEPLKDELKKLVKKIEKENNRDDYLAFAEFIGTSEAYMIMDMIYQFSEFGVKEDALQELVRYTETLQENKVDELINKKMLQMDKYGYGAIFISMFLVGGFAVLIFMYYMKDVMDAINVLP